MLEKLYKILNEVIPNKVFYGINVYDDNSLANMPYIVYQELNSRKIGSVDDIALTYTSLIQITLVTKHKDIILEKKLEKALLEANFSYILSSEFFNSDKSINRIYEINMEEFYNGK